MLKFMLLPVTMQSWINAQPGILIIVRYIASAWFAYGLHRRGWLDCWYQRLLGLCTLVIGNTFLSNQAQHCPPFLYLSLIFIATTSIIDFIQGYGITVTNRKPPIHEMNPKKRSFLTILIFFTIIFYLLTTFNQIDDTGLQFLTAMFSSNDINLLRWALLFGWALIITEGSWTYSDFTGIPYMPWLPWAMLSAYLFINNLFWGNQLCNFISTQIHPLIPELCAVIYIIMALWEIITWIRLWLKTNAQHFTIK